VLNGLGSLPRPILADEYHWAAAANAAVAAQTHNLFPTATSQNLAAIDALEQELRSTFRAETSPAVYDRSVAFGKDLAAALFAWSKTDGGDAGYTPQFSRRL
jgi:hypothetical protein